VVRVYDAICRIIRSFWLTNPWGDGFVQASRLAIGHQGWHDIAHEVISGADVRQAVRLLVEF
jgi:hypothetical protein